jgi:hypothetical protein
MPVEELSIPDVVHMLAEGTKKGSIQWTAEDPTGDAFLTTFPAGGVRLSRVITFTGSPNLGGPLLVELLDPRGHTIFQDRPQTPEDLVSLEELFSLARRQALNLDQTLAALLEEIRKRSGTR